MGAPFQSLPVSLRAGAGPAAGGWGNADKEARLWPQPWQMLGGLSGALSRWPQPGILCMGPLHR